MAPGRDRRDITLCVHASEPSPAYPALLASAIDVVEGDLVDLRVQAMASRNEPLDAVANAASMIAIVPASTAVRAICRGLRARIVCAAVAPADYATFDSEPAVPLGPSNDGPRARVRRPRAVLIASEHSLVAESVQVGAAVRVYWRCAAAAIADPVVLTVALACEFELPYGAAAREAERALATWRLEPAVSWVGLRAVVHDLIARGEVPAVIDVGAILDERFVRADRRRASADNDSPPTPWTPAA